MHTSTPDRQPRQHTTTQFLQTGCRSCRPTNSVKALKGQGNCGVIYYFASDADARVTNERIVRRRV